MSFWQFLVAHRSETWGSLMSLLYLVAEYLANNPKIAANSPFQFIKGYLKQQSDQAPKP